MVSSSLCSPRLSQRATRWRAGALSQVDDWITSEQASPALDAAFRASAEAILDDLLTDEAIHYLSDWTMGVAEADGRTTGDIAALITLATEGSPVAGEGVLPFATDLHYAPLGAIAAQALGVGDEAQQGRSVALFRELAEQGVPEYAVALCWPLSSAGLPDSDRRHWREVAEREWAPSVRGLHGDWGSMISFGTHYVRHLLAAAIAAGRLANEPLDLAQSLPATRRPSRR